MINNIAISGISKLVIDFMINEDIYNNMAGTKYLVRYLVNVFLYNNLFLNLGSIIYLPLSCLSIGMSKCTKFLGFPLRSVRGGCYVR